MSRFGLIPFILFLVFSQAHSAQPYEPMQPDPLLEPWRWRSFPELQGLGLECMTEDRDGNMWFGVAKRTSILYRNTGPGKVVCSPGQRCCL